MSKNLPDGLFAGTIAKTPTVLQMESVECGAACLSMIFEYYGLHIPLEEIRLMCGVSRDGCKLSNMAVAARAAGFDVFGYTVEPIDLLALETPSIIHWDFKHFVVFEGIRNGKVYINDPSHGPRVINFQEFDQLFTGVVLELKKNNNFRRAGKRSSLGGFLKNRLQGAYSALSYLIISGLLLVPPTILIPAFYRIFVDDILVGQQIYWYKPLIIIMIFTAAVQASIMWLEKTALLYTSIRATIYNSGNFFYHLLRLPTEFFNQRYAGDIGSRLSLNDKIADLVFDDLSIAVLNIICSLFIGLVMFFYNVPMAIVSITIVSLNFIVLKYASRKIADANQLLECEAGKMTGNAMKGLQVIETLKSMGGEQEFFEQISGYQAKVINASSELSFWTQVLSSASPSLSAINVMSILLLGGFFVMRGEMTVGLLVGFEMIALMLITMVGELVGFGGTLQEAKADMRRLNDVNNYSEEARYSIEEDRKEPADCKLTGGVELKGVTFGYSRLEAPLIKDFNLKIKPSSRIGLVGLSGSGKTTVAKLIMGLYEPWEGQILIGDRPISEISKQLLADFMAMVGQDLYLFNGSVRDNISMWDESMGMDNILAASRDACLDDAVISRHGGYDSIIDEGGVNFSGGERQRLEIATALASNPSFLILDESTSSLDSHTEKSVSDNIKKRGMTCLILAHRLSTVRDCDEIIVIKNGSIIQRGTHEELKSVEGIYSDMIKTH